MRLHLASISLVLIMLAQGQAQYGPQIDITSSHVVETMGSLSACNSMPSSLEQSAQNNGFVKVACPFGVFLFATSSFSDDWLLYAANALDFILDQDQNGVADDGAVVASLTDYGNGEGGGIFCGVSQDEEQQEENVSDDTGIRSFSCQTWKAPETCATEFRWTLNEEIFHMVHNVGYARVYPAQFGIDDFTSSVLAREAASHQCLEPGWLHPENECPSGYPASEGPAAPSPLTGTCSEADCDVSEFFYIVATTLSGDGEAGWSDSMPTTVSEMRALLSQDFLDVYDDAQYSMLQTVIPTSYTLLGTESCDFNDDGNDFDEEEEEEEEEEEDGDENCGLLCC